MSPTRRTAWALAVVAVAVVFLPVALGVVAVAAILVAAVVDAFAVRQTVAITRVVSPVVSRGVASPVTVSLSRNAVGTVVVRQPVPDALTLTPDEASEALEAVLLPRRRGRYTLPPPVVRRIGPLGLGRWDRPTSLAPVELAVFPDLVSARALVNRVRRGRFGSAGRQARGPLGLGTEFELIREYAPDDDIRQVNWRATARVGRPMSNQYRVEQDRDVVCLLDLGRLMAAPVGDRTRLDVGLDAMTVLGLVADELGDRFGIIAFDDAVRRNVAPRRSGGTAAVRACFDLEARSVDADYSTAFSAVGGSKRALVTVLTDLLDEAAASSLVAAMPTLARRHAVVVASVRDADLIGLTRRAPSAPLQVYEASVAADVLAARDRTAQRLRGAGATVIEASPDALGRACVDAYLNAKARARL